MAAVDDPLCCHFELARNLSSKELCSGVRARDKLLWDVIEDKQEKIFMEEGLAATDKGKKELKTLLGLVRREVEKEKESCGQHGFVKLQLMTKSGSVIGGFFRIGKALVPFIVDKKKKKNKMAITVERDLMKGIQIMKSLVDAAAYQGAKGFVFTFPLRCTSCQPRLKEARYQHC